MTSWMWWAASTSLKRLSRGSGSTLYLLLSTTWLAFPSLPVGDCKRLVTVHNMISSHDSSSNLSRVCPQVFSFPLVWCYSHGWALLRWRCHLSLWFCPPFFSNGNEIFNVEAFLSVCFVFLPFWVYSSKTIFQSRFFIRPSLSFFLCLCLVTLSPLPRSWRPDWGTAGGRAACPTSASTLAWARCVVPPPNSAFWTASSTTAAPPSAPYALTSTRSTAWFSVSPTNTRCWWGRRCVRRSFAEYVRLTWARDGFCVLK